MKRLTLLFIGALLFPFASLSQSYEQTKDLLSVLTKEQACDDIDSLIYTLNEIHPDMFSECNLGNYMKQVNEVKESLPDSVTIVQLYDKVAPLVSLIGDGHTCMVFPYNEVFTEKLRRLPLQVEIDDNTAEATVILSAFPKLVPEKAKLISINGVSVKDMIDWMLRYCSGERRFFQLQRLSYDFLAFFQMRYTADNYKVKFIYDGKEKEATLPSKTYEEEKITLETLKHKKVNNQPEIPYSFSISDDNRYAIMDFNNMVDPDRMTVFADSMVSELKQRGVPNLIIDIRSNGGGLSNVGDTLLRRISPYPFQQFSKFYARVTPSTLKCASTPDMPNSDMPPLGVYFDELDEYVQPFADSTKRYNGKLWLLINHGTFSSAGSFSWAFKQLHLGTVVGEESGGMNVCYGDIVVYRMPLSHLATTISWKRFWQFEADEKEVHGTMPDIEVPSSDALNYTINEIEQAKVNY